MKKADDNRLVIDVTRIDPEGDQIQGEIECVDLNEEFVRSFGGVRYDLTLQMFGTELLVRGKLDQDFDLVCSRCGKDYDDTIHVEDFTASFEISEKEPEIDITDELRQAVILELPTYPMCNDNCTIPRLPDAPQPVGDDRWSALDGLKH